MHTDVLTPFQQINAEFRLRAVYVLNNYWTKLLNF